jgi:hypothetical protein
VIKLAKDLALGQLQMSEEVWENHVKKGANGILALLEKSKAELDAAKEQIAELEKKLETAKLLLGDYFWT